MQSASDHILHHVHRLAVSIVLRQLGTAHGMAAVHAHQAQMRHRVVVTPQTVQHLLGGRGIVTYQHHVTPGGQRHLGTFLGKGTTQLVVKKVIDKLQAAGVVVVNGDKIAYNLQDK